MTALSVHVSDEILNDGKKLAFSTEANAGVASRGNLTKMSALREDNSMFKQGIPSNFLAVMTATVVWMERRSMTVLPIPRIFWMLLRTAGFLSPVWMRMKKERT